MSDFLTSDRLPGLIQAAYIIAGILFIGALAGLSKHETAKRGNLFGMAGMGLALKDSPPGFDPTTAADAFGTDDDGDTGFAETEQY